MALKWLGVGKPETSAARSDPEGVHPEFHPVFRLGAAAGATEKAAKGLVWPPAIARALAWEAGLWVPGKKASLAGHLVRAHHMRVGGTRGPYVEAESII